MPQLQIGKLQACKLNFVPNNVLGSVASSLSKLFKLINSRYTIAICYQHYHPHYTTTTLQAVTD